MIRFCTEEFMLAEVIKTSLSQRDRLSRKGNDPTTKLILNGSNFRCSCSSNDRRGSLKETPVLNRTVTDDVRGHRVVVRVKSFTSQTFLSSSFHSHLSCL